MVIVLTFGSAILSGCVYRIPLEAAPDLPVGIEKAPITVGVSYTPEFRDCEYVHDQVHKYVLPLGQASMTLFAQVFPAVFQDTVLLSGPRSSARQAKKIDAVIVPAIESYSLELPWYPMLYGDYTAEITYRFTLYSAVTGSQVASWSVSASARRAAHINNTSRAEVAEVTNEAMKTAAKKFIEDFKHEPEVHYWVEHHRVEESEVSAAQLTPPGQQETGSETEALQESGTVPDGKLLFQKTTPRKPRNSISLLLGFFKDADNPGKVHAIHGPQGMFAFDLGFLLNDHFTSEGGLSYFVKEYKVLNRSTLLPGAVENNIQIQTVGFEATAKYVYPFRVVSPFIGAGLGLFNTRLSLQTKTRPANVAFFDPYSYTGQQKTVFGYHFTAGADFILPHLERHSLGIEYRKIIVKVGFGEFTNGSVDVGGDLVAFVYRYRL